MPEDEIVRWTLLFSALAALFAGLALFKPLFKLTWNNWLRYRWYRTVVALREDRTYALLDLPSGIKDVVLVCYTRYVVGMDDRPLQKIGLRASRVAPFYRPNRCVYNTTLPRLQPGCSFDLHCGTLKARHDPERPHSRHNRLVRVVRNRPPKQRAERFAEKAAPCSGCGETSGMVRQQMAWGPDEVQTTEVPLMMFYMGEDRWLCPACFGVPDDLHDLLPTVD